MKKIVLFRVTCLLNNGQYGQRQYARHSTITLSAENTTKLNFAAKTVTTNNLFPLLFPPAELEHATNSVTIVVTLGLL